LQLLKLYITNRCGRYCFFCFNRKDGIFDLNPELAYKFHSWLEKESGQEIPVMICGGDPPLHPLFDDFLKLFKNKIITILMNPSSLDENMIRKIKDSGIPMIGFSIDGLEKKHDEIRGKGDFGLTIEKIHKLINNGVRVKISFTVRKDNFSELIPVMRFLSKNISKFIFSFERMIPMDENAKNFFLDDEAYYNGFSEIWFNFLKLRKDNKGFVLKPNDDYWKIFLNNTLNIKSDSRYCSLGKILIVLENGDISFCPKLKEHIFNINSRKWSIMDIENRLKLYRKITESSTKCAAVNSLGL